MGQGEAAIRPVSRAAAPSDVVALAELAGELGYPTEPADMARRLAALPEEDEIWVATIDGRVVGWAHCTIRKTLILDPHLEVLAIVVAEGARGLGIGRQLMAAAERWARAHGLSVVRLRSGVHREHAHAFYLGLGYRELKRSAIFVRELED